LNFWKWTEKIAGGISVKIMSGKSLCVRNRPPCNKEEPLQENNWHTRRGRWRRVRSGPSVGLGLDQVPSEGESWGGGDPGGGGTDETKRSKIIPKGKTQ